MSQMSFFDKLPGTRWVELKPDSTLVRFWPPGQRFLVIEEKEDGCLLCWKDGIPPQMWPLTRGTLINPKNIQEVSDHEHQARIQGQDSEAT